MLDCLDTTVQPLFIGVHEVPRWIERVRPHVERMAKGSGGRYEAADIVGALALGEMQMWIMVEGPEILCVLVTEIVRYPRKRALRAIGIAGHQHRKWTHLVAAIERAARDCFGCQLAEALVQPGHERLLKTGAWKLFHTLWEKAL